MEETRLRSSFIYLANAVNDLRGNWLRLALAIAPLVIAAGVCLLPDAVNLQYEVVHTFRPGLHSVAGASSWGAWPSAALRAAPRPFPHWSVVVLHLLGAAVTLAVNLVGLCALQRIRGGKRAGSLLGELAAVYRRSGQLAKAFAWVVVLQWLATLIGFILLVVPGLLAYVWLYFAQYALICDERRGWEALLHSRQLLRGLFLKVAVRIVVFFAVSSGFNSWAGGVFFAVSLVLGGVGLVTGLLWAAVLVVDLLAVSVLYATMVFVLAAGLRLYEDLALAQRAGASAVAAITATASLSRQAT